MKKSIFLFLAALALATTATAQVEFVSTPIFVHGFPEGSINIGWGVCLDGLTQECFPVKIEQDGDEIHFTVWANSLKEPEEFTIKNSQLSDGMGNLIRLSNELIQTRSQIIMSKNLFSFDDKFVVGIYQADGTAVLYNEKSEKAGVIPFGLVSAPLSYIGATLSYAYFYGIPYLAGIENKNGDRPVYAISCWADKSQALHKQADLTSDGQVDVADVSTVIDIVLGRQ